MLNKNIFVVLQVFSVIRRCIFVYIGFVQKRIFVFAKLVKRKQLYFWNAHGLKQKSKLFCVFRSIIESWNDWNSWQNFFMHFYCNTHIGKNLSVIHSGSSFVFYRIPVLHVHQYIIHMIQYFSESDRICISCGFTTGMNAGFVCFL